MANIQKSRPKCEGCNRRCPINDIQNVNPMSRSKKYAEIEWIQCSNCDGLFHHSCTGLEQFQIYSIRLFHCSQCSPRVGKSIEYEKVAPHRTNWFDPTEKDLPIEVGSESWIRYEYPKWAESVEASNTVEIVENGYELLEKLNVSNWDTPYLVRSADGLQMKMPPPSFELENVVEFMGDDYEVDTIDVYHQTTFSMKLSTFLQKFRDTENRDRLYNSLSLEFSHHDVMNKLAEPPQFVQDISMVNAVWPAGKKDDQTPRVEQYCLASMGGSFTDFHVDFGGSSVYYHILRGQKIFFVAPPTEENFRLYEDHATSSLPSAWFGNLSSIRKLSIGRGETLLVPSGWIHAVFTPEDSLVFGGNFLHFGNIPMQMRVYRMEEKIRRTVGGDEKFYFPHFEALHWGYAKEVLIRRLSEESNSSGSMGNFTWQNIKKLHEELKFWMERKRGGVRCQELTDRKIIVQELKEQLEFHDRALRKRGRNEDERSEEVRKVPRGKC